MSAPIVIVGGGLAAGKAAGELRELGYDGDIVLFAAEDHAPYERPPLSKGMLLGKETADSTAVHEPAWYADNNVDVRTGTAVTAIDTDAHTVTAGDETLTYDKLLLATGAQPRHLPLADDSGADTVYLRTIEDSQRLLDSLKPGTRIAIIGAGWIGLEVAAAAREAGAEVTVLESLDQPLLRVLGPEVATVFADMHREHGVDLRTGVNITAISKNELTLEDGATVGFDLLVVGVGVAPDVALAESAGLDIDNGIRTDAHLQTSAPDVFAAGDVANADHPVLGHPLRVEHWDTAIKHGKVAAANMLGRDVVADALPYFFTDQYDFGMEYVGNPGPEGYDRVVMTGDVPGRTFRAYWLRGDRVVAGMHANDWDAIDEVRRRVGSTVDPDELGTQA